MFQVWSWLEQRSGAYLILLNLSKGSGPSLARGCQQQLLEFARGQLSWDHSRKTEVWECRPGQRVCPLSSAEWLAWACAQPPWSAGDCEPGPDLGQCLPAPTCPPRWVGSECGSSHTTRGRQESRSQNLGQNQCPPVGSQTTAPHPCCGWNRLRVKEFNL